MIEKPGSREEILKCKVCAKFAKSSGVNSEDHCTGRNHLQSLEKYFALSRTQKVQFLRDWGRDAACNGMRQAWVPESPDEERRFVQGGQY